MAVKSGSKAACNLVNTGIGHPVETDARVEGAVALRNGAEADCVTVLRDDLDRIRLARLADRFDDGRESDRVRQHDVVRVGVRLKRGSDCCVCLYRVERVGDLPIDLGDLAATATGHHLCELLVAGHEVRERRVVAG